MKLSMNHPHPADETTCPAPEIAADLKAYSDNELSLLRRRTVATHLRRCAACRAEIAAMTNIADEIKTADAGSTSTALNSDIRRRLLERIAAEQPLSPSLSTARTLPLWRRKPLLVFGGAAAYAAVFLVCAALLFPTFGKSKQYARQVGAGAFADQRQDNMNDRAKAYAGPFSKEFDPPGRGIPGTIGGSRTAAVITAKSSLAQTAQTAQIALEERASQPSQPSQSGSFGVIDGRQVHREGSLTVAVDKLEAASDKVEQAVKASGGFVAGNTLNTDSDGYKSADLTVRVPVAQFDDILRQFAALGDVTAKSIYGEDITERVSDATQAEQVLKDAAEAAARRLKSGSGSEKDIRYRESDLRHVRIELAQTQARLGLLRKMAKLSTINVSLTEKAKRAVQAPPSGFLGDMSETNRMASAAFASAIRVPVVLIIWVLAFSPLWVPLVLLYRYASRRSGPDNNITPAVSSIEA